MLDWITSLLFFLFSPSLSVLDVATIITVVHFGGFWFLAIVPWLWYSYKMKLKHQ
jgi:hypothetical protein